ncbi:hypothetical protein ACLBXM_10975 [Xanthobacteraceae bacterium A53D]
MLLALATAILLPGIAAAQPAPSANPASSVACSAPDRYLTPKLGLRRAADALRTDKRLRVLVFSSIRMPAVSAQVEAKRYPVTLTKTLKGLFPEADVSVNNVIETRAGISDSLKGLTGALAAQPYDLVIWQLGSTDVLRGTDMDLFGEKLAAGIGEVRARQADAIVMSMQYSPRTDFVFDAGPYAQYLRWMVKAEGGALFNRYDIMRYWVEDGVFDLSELKPGASIFEDVHRCVGNLLARFIANGIAAPETQ